MATVDGTAQLVTITINGTNDAAVITGDATGTVVEAGGVANGTPARRPRAAPQFHRCRQSGDTGRRSAGDREHQRLRQVHVTAAGVWTYTLDNTNAAVQALKSAAR